MILDSAHAGKGRAACRPPRSQRLQMRKKRKRRRARRTRHDSSLLNLAGSPRGYQTDTAPLRTLYKRPASRDG